MTKYNNVVVSAIAALGSQRQLGKDNELLWHIPEDLQRFKELTTRKTVIMGRKTWESLPESVRPLPDRENIVLTRDENYEAPGAVVMNDINEAVSYAKDWSKEYSRDEIFIIGGATIYEQALPQTERLYLTLVNSDKKGDTFFPEYEDRFTVIRRESREDGNLSYDFVILEQ